ncbi:MAG: dipicolinate synthase subunit DpsA [Firmicutes bacterium]|nr:dipicolinate synthase subunit DpsA [Bacillota bacterium]
MKEGLRGLVVCILGGNFREIQLIRRLLAEKALVKLVGYPPLNELAGTIRETGISKGMLGASVIIVGMGKLDIGTKIKTLDPELNLNFTVDVLKSIPKGRLLLVGTAGSEFRELALKYGINLVEVMENDEVAIKNSIPTAEGALQIAMTEMPITIHGCNAIVLGFGRVGITMARVLLSLSANTVVCARSYSQLARASEMGALALHISSLSSALSDTDVVFNTIPSTVLTDQILENMKPGSLIIDLASAPGGTDFDAAARLGIKAILASGLPGKTAPKTAGKILADAILRLIKERLDNPR